LDFISKEENNADIDPYENENELYQYKLENIKKLELDRNNNICLVYLRHIYIYVNHYQKRKPRRYILYFTWYTFANIKNDCNNYIAWLHWKNKLTWYQRNDNIKHCRNNNNNIKEDQINNKNNITL